VKKYPDIMGQKRKNLKSTLTRGWECTDELRIQLLVKELSQKVTSDFSKTISQQI
jgi:hypothetical protein